MSAKEETKISVETVLSIRVIDNPNKYLGVPTIRGKSNMDVVDFLMDKLRVMLQGWKYLHLNNSGREVLIKVVMLDISMTHKLMC